jgi:uncharacterized FlaG/YvyC family protein
MTEEEISSSGQFAALNTGEATASYQPASSTVHPGVTATPAAPAVAELSPSAGKVRLTSQAATQEIDSAIAAANANLASTNRLLDYRVDSDSGLSIALIRDSRTGEVLQQIPGADLLALARLLAEWAPGKHMLVDLKA